MSSSQLDLLRLHRTEVRELLAGFGFNDLRTIPRQPEAVLACPGADVTLGDLLNAEEALSDFLLTDLEIISTRSELGRELTPGSVAL